MMTPPGSIRVSSPESVSGLASAVAATATVTVIVPCRNERDFIAACLDSVLANDWAPDRLEVLVVDGMSDDGTREILGDYASRHPAVRMLDNPRRITPTALNIGVRAAGGSVIVRMDAHNRYPRHYISRLVHWLFETGADNVGGVWITRPARDTAVARAIAACLSHPFGVGNAYFRIGSAAPRWVDTVPFGCYRREVFERIGLFDEELVRNQDDEFNLRLIRQGGRILLVPEIATEYYARESLAKLWQMYYQYGYFKPLVVRKVGGVFTLRQLVPALFVLSLGGAALLAPWGNLAVVPLAVLVVPYALLNVACSGFIATKHGVRAGLAATIAFSVLHVSYGIGFLKGIADVLFRTGRRDRDFAAVPISR